MANPPIPLLALTSAPTVGPMAKEPDEAILNMMREMGTALVEKLNEIDAGLLVNVASGDTRSANYSRAAQGQPSAPTSAPARPVEILSWWKSFPDGHTWTDVWGQAPPR